MSRSDAVILQPRRRPVPPPPAPDPGRQVQAVDVSNWQGPIRQYLAKWAAWGVEHVVVRLSTESAALQDMAMGQLAESHRAGLSTSGYVWCYFDQRPEPLINAALKVAQDTPGVELATVWLDAEDTVPVGTDAIAWLRAAANHLGFIGYRVGMYTAGWWWQRYGLSDGKLTDLPLWAANYDGDPSLEAFRPFGGWTKQAGKQWTDQPLDRDTFAAWVTLPERNP